MDGVGPESLDITEKSLFSHVFSFVFIWNPRPHCAGSNFLGRKEGRKDGTTNSFVIYSNCWLCSSPTETMSLWKPIPAGEEQPEFYSYSWALTPSCWRCANGLEYFIPAKKPKTPTREWLQAEFLIPSGKEQRAGSQCRCVWDPILAVFRFPFQVCLGSNSRCVQDPIPGVFRISF